MCVVDPCTASAALCALCIIELYPVGDSLQTDTQTFSDLIYYPYPRPGTRFFRHTYPVSAGTRIGQRTELFEGIIANTHTCYKDYLGLGNR